MSRVLLTGADGFTGRYLVPLLIARGHDVHGMSLKGEGRTPDAAAWHAGDLTDPADAARVVATAKPEHVIHLGGISHVASDPTRLYLVNLMGTRHLLDALSRLPSRPRSVILASSANVYGNRTEGTLSEETPASPANDYGISKLAMEQVASLFSERLPLVITRPFNYTGIGQAETFLIPKIVAHARRKAPTIELGNIDVARDFSDVRNIAEAYARLMECDAAVGCTVNLCSGTAQSLRDILATVRELCGWAPEVAINPSLVRQQEVRTLKGSRAKLDSLLGGAVRPTPFGETLRWMLASGPAQA